MNELRKLLRDISSNTHYLPISSAVQLGKDLKAIQIWAEQKCAEIEHLKRENFGLKQSVRNKAETLEKLGGYSSGKYGKSKVKR